MIPMNLQFFAEPGEGNNAGAGTQQGNNAGTGTNNGDGNNNNAGNSANNQNGQQTPEIDYEKLASIVEGRQTAAGDAALKNYFKQQGLSQEEVAKAISDFKAQKAKNTPDVSAMQTQLSEVQQANLQLQINNEATLQAIKEGISTETLPYILKLADFSKAVGEDGKINNEEIKNAINKVLEDVPQLKPSAESQNTTNIQIGAPNGNSNTNNTSGAGNSNNNNGVPKKRWNRFN
ncbi:MAG: hypothetical protein K6G85_07415 [Eubacterium sp.]|nr:hypothetical protein [Eubacterium sp.]